jgi:hypothetical protein
MFLNFPIFDFRKTKFAPKEFCFYFYFSIFVFPPSKKKMSTNFIPLHAKDGTQPRNNHVLGSGASSAAAILHTKEISNEPDEDIQTGRTKPPLRTVQDPQSVNVVVDSKDRTNLANPNGFNFRFLLNSNLFRASRLRVSKAQLPFPPNINVKNNVLYWSIYNGSQTTYLSYRAGMESGYYSPEALADEMNYAMNNLDLGFNPSLPAGVSFLTTYDPLTRRLTTTMSTAGDPDPWYWVFRGDAIVSAGLNTPTSRNFNNQRNGEVFGYFPSVNTIPLFPGNPLLNKLSYHSSVMTMHYTRYVFLCSEAFNIFSFADTRSSDVELNEDVMAVLDLLSEPSDGGLVKTVVAHRSPNISVRNPQRSLAPEGDLYVLDDYGDDLGDLWQSVYTAEFPPKPKPGQLPPPSPWLQGIGVSVWFEVSF